jgi:hypothetical protein
LGKHNLYHYILPVVSTLLEILLFIVMLWVEFCFSMYRFQPFLRFYAPSIGPRAPRGFVRFQPF